MTVQQVGHHGPPSLSVQLAAPVPQARPAERAGGKDDKQVPSQAPPQQQASYKGLSPPLAQPVTLVPQARLVERTGGRNDRQVF